METKEAGSWVEKKKLKIDDLNHCGGTGSKDTVSSGEAALLDRGLCVLVWKNVCLWNYTVSDAYGDFP